MSYTCPYFTLDLALEELKTGESHDQKWPVWPSGSELHEKVKGNFDHSRTTLIMWKCFAHDIKKICWSGSTRVPPACPKKVLEKSYSDKLIEIKRKK